MVAGQKSEEWFFCTSCNTVKGIEYLRVLALHRYEMCGTCVDCHVKAKRDREHIIYQGSIEDLAINRVEPL